MKSTFSVFIEPLQLKTSDFQRKKNHKKTPFSFSSIDSMKSSFLWLEIVNISPMLPGNLPYHINNKQNSQEMLGVCVNGYSYLVF